MVCWQAHEVQEHHRRDGFETVRPGGKSHKVAAREAGVRLLTAAPLTCETWCLQANADGIFESTSMRQQVPTH